jgi:hypothetical protein
MSGNKKEMVWNVFYHNTNSKKIEFFNIFNHWRFREAVEKALKKSKSREELEQKVRSELFYFFNSKFEWETLITSFPEDVNKTIKVDVYWQVINNFDRFIDYVARNKRFRKISGGVADKVGDEINR